MAFQVCWEDHCLNVRSITLCRRCERPFCSDHLDDLTSLCMWCVPVAEEEYQKWIIKEQP